MAGNVAEWVADVYRPISLTTKQNDFNYYRGNRYAKNKIGKDGKVENCYDRNNEKWILYGKIIR
jgi:formylglycine-generating enzyme required for sulfatase activity